MKKADIQLCTAIFSCKDKLMSKNEKVWISDEQCYRNVTLTVNPESIEISFNALSSSYKIQFKSNEATLKYHYFYKSWDEGVEHEITSNLLIRGGQPQPLVNHKLDINKNTFYHTEKKYDGPMEDSEINKHLGLVVDTLERVISNDILKSAVARFDKESHCAAFFTASQAARTATKNTKNLKSNLGLYKMSEGTVMADLFRSQIAPLAGFEVSAEDMKKYETIVHKFCK